VTSLGLVLSGHSKTRAYLYRFNLREDAKCICYKDDQTMDNLLFHCTNTSTQRDLIKLQLSKQKNWPTNKVELITKHRKVFSEFIESIDFDLLQRVINRTVCCKFSESIEVDTVQKRDK